MARSFDGTGDYITLPSNHFTPSNDFTVMCWFQYAASSSYRCLWSDTLTKRFLGMNGALLYVQTDAGAKSATGATSLTTNTWYHAAMVKSSTAGLIVYLNGVQDGINGTATAASATGSDEVFGAEPLTGITAYNWNGKMAEFGFYDAVLTADELLQAAKGISPKAIRPGNLTNYWPLIGTTTNEFDIVGGAAGTVTNATKTEHTRVIYPKRTRTVYVPDAAAGGLSIPIAAYHYNHSLRA